MLGVEVKIPRTPKYNVDFLFAALPTMSQRPSIRVLNIVSGGGPLRQVDSQALNPVANVVAPPYFLCRCRWLPQCKCRHTTRVKEMLFFLVTA